MWCWWTWLERAATSTGWCRSTTCGQTRSCLLAEESGERPYFRPERTRISRRDVLGFIGRCSPEGPPKFNIQRLRITWIVAHLAAGTHLAALEQAAGVTADQLVKYLVYVAPLDEAEVRHMLVGAP